MFKRILATLMLIGLATTLFGGCGSAGPGKPESKINLDGTWKADADGALFTATIAADRIKIDMKLRDTSGLYWAGSFTSNIDSPQPIQSGADTEVLKSSMFGSLDKEKTFTYRDDAISFTMGIAGTTREVHLTKEKN